MHVSDWVDEQLPVTNILRLIYQGRFLHGNVTLGGTMKNFCDIYFYGNVSQC